MARAFCKPMSSAVARARPARRPPQALGQQVGALSSALGLSRQEVAGLLAAVPPIVAISQASIVKDRWGGGGGGGVVVVWWRRWCNGRIRPRPLLGVCPCPSKQASNPSPRRPPHSPPSQAGDAGGQAEAARRGQRRGQAGGAPASAVVHPPAARAGGPERARGGSACAVHALPCAPAGRCAVHAPLPHAPPALARPSAPRASTRCTGLRTHMATLLAARQCAAQATVPAISKALAITEDEAASLVARVPVVASLEPQLLRLEVGQAPA